MKPVDMLVQHDPPDAIGDCFRCVVASIFELPAEEVPHFGQYDWGEDGERGRTALREWLVPRGFYYLDVEWTAEQIVNWEPVFQFHHLMSGLSARGTRHACVGYGGKVVHDPHPSRSGIMPDDGKYLIGMFVKR